MNRAFNEFTTNFPTIASLTGAALGLWIAACTLYLIFSPFRARGKLRAFNIAEGVSLSGTWLGLCFPLVGCLIVKEGLAQFLLWGGVLMLFCLFAFRLLDQLIGPLKALIEQDRVGVALLLATAKVVVSLILLGGLFTS